VSAAVEAGSAVGPRSALGLLRQRRTDNRLRWAAAVSLTLHAAVLGAVLIGADRAGRGVRDVDDAHPMVELVMVEQKGAGKPVNAGPPPSDRTAPDHAMPEEASKAAPSVPSPPAPAVPPSVPPPEVQSPSPAAEVPSLSAPAAEATPSPPPVPPPPATSTEAELLPPPPPPAPPAPPLPSPPAPPRPAVPPRQQAPVEAPVRQAMQRPPSPAAPAPPSPAAPAPAPASPTPPAPTADAVPRINLGGTDSLTNALAQGDEIIPAGPDPKVHNRDPVYPFEAVRRGQQGLVILLIHVSPEGLPVEVDIASSSGFSLLDRAARDAVNTWRFVPAVRDGQPIPSTMSLRIHFALD
jgi:TonB family protein